jgi:ribonuclease HI
MDKVVIHTDGACRGNPGPGGWGAILSNGVHAQEGYHGVVAAVAPPGLENRGAKAREKH